jgi:hypothetical protein
MMEAASTSDKSENFYQTAWCNNPEDSHFITKEELSMCASITSRDSENFHKDFSEPVNH